MRPIGLAVLWGPYRYQTPAQPYHPVVRPPLPTLLPHRDVQRSRVRAMLDRLESVRPTPLRVAAAVALGGAFLVATTAAVFVLEGGAIGLEDASPAYLVAVVVIGSTFGTLAAVVEALVAFALYDLLFTEPRLSLTVSDPREWLDLLLFLFVAIAIGRLVAIQRDRAEEADRRAREATSFLRHQPDPRHLDDGCGEDAPEIARRLPRTSVFEAVWIAPGPAWP